MAKKKHQPVIDPPIPQGINCTDQDAWHCFVNSIGEEYTVDFIKRYLRTEEQRQKLFEADLSIEDCLNGRYNDAQFNLFIKEMYKDWNNKLGEKRFRG